ncbi:MAG: hypothetical protein HOI58_04590, partial [Kordiimonadaceae bacterium]|nr:hypothetical protein [Kordiimonadaceae bacterium]
HDDPYINDAQNDCGDHYARDYRKNHGRSGEITLPKFAINKPQDDGNDKTADDRSGDDNLKIYIVAECERV